MEAPQSTSGGKRVLIVSASAGTGHVRAGEALAKAFRMDPSVEAVHHLDALDYTNKLFRDFYSKLYIQLVKSAPDVLGWVYRVSDEPWKTDAARVQLERLNTRRLVRFIRAFNPHITVCTHFMPAGIMSHLIQTERLEAQLSIVVTDLDVHAMWLSRTFHRYFVAIEETKIHLEALGIPGERVTVSGIPTDPAFSEPADPAALKRAWGLDPRCPTLLFSAGAYGVSPAELIVGRLRNLKHRAQTVVVCGKSESARQRVEALVGPDADAFRVLGFTDEMPDLMRMADLFIGKPGGLTTAEALACGVPMVILSPIPGQEERNSDHLLEEGAAVKCNELTTIAYKIDRLLGDPGRLEGMRGSARALGRPHAARDVVRTLIEDRLAPMHMKVSKGNATAMESLERER
jgi:processive 1,2-diacylglycerol beta-glucosyltransferase